MSGDYKLAQDVPGDNELDVPVAWGDYEKVVPVLAWGDYKLVQDVPSDCKLVQDVQGDNEMVSPVLAWCDCELVLQMVCGDLVDRMACGNYELVVLSPLMMYDVGSVAGLGVEFSAPRGVCGHVWAQRRFGRVLRRGRLRSDV